MRSDELLLSIMECEASVSVTIVVTEGRSFKVFLVRPMFAPHRCLVPASLHPPHLRPLVKAYQHPSSTPSQLGIIAPEKRRERWDQGKIESERERERLAAGYLFGRQYDNFMCLVRLRGLCVSQSDIILIVSVIRCKYCPQ